MLIFYTYSKYANSSPHLKTTHVNTLWEKQQKMKALHKYLKTTHVNSLYFKLVVTPNSSSNLKTTHVNTLSYCKRIFTIKSPI